MTCTLTQTLERAAMVFFIALATLPIIGMPMLAVAARGVIN